MQGMHRANLPFQRLKERVARLRRVSGMQMRTEAHVVVQRGEEGECDPDPCDKHVESQQHGLRR